MPLMCYWYTYGIVTILLLSVLSYMIGHNSHKMDTDDLGANVVFGGAIIIFWPIVIVIAMIVGPFLGPYYLGKRHHRIKTEKEQMWQTLKK